MTERKNRYQKYQLALTLGTKLKEMQDSVPEWATLPSPELYALLEQHGYFWHEGEKAWLSYRPTAEKPKHQKPKPTAGIPESELFKVRIIAPVDKIDALAETTRLLYEMTDCECLKQTKPSTGRWLVDKRIVYFDFRRPR